MAAISGANPIVTSDINNFTGELFKITPHRTPLLAAAGGLNGGIVSNTTYFQFQTQDNETISSVTLSWMFCGKFHRASCVCMYRLFWIFHISTMSPFSPSMSL